MSNILVESSNKNYLKLFTEMGDPDVDQTARLLEVSRNQLAETFGLSADQIRPERLSSLAKERIGELAGTLELVADIFKGDQKKTIFWIKTPNPHFGGMSPRSLIVRGRYNKVKQFVLAAASREQQSA